MTKGLISLVRSKAAITDLIGTAPMRFFPRLLPQGMSDFPAAAYRVVVENDNPPLNDVSRLDFAAVDIQCYGRRSGDIEQLFKTFRRQLEGSSGTYSGIQIVEVVYVPSGAEDYLDELELYTKQLELRIDYIRQP